MPQPILLADFIETVRGELADAMIRRREHKASADAIGAYDPVGDLNLTEVTIEAHVAASRESTGKAGLKVWVIAAEGSVQSGASTLHKVVIKLSPRSGELLLGSASSVRSVTKRRKRS